MATVLSFPQPRSLATVLLEIGQAEREVARWDAAAIADPHGFDARGDDYRFAEADAHLSSLRGEAITMIYDLTGVRFSDIERALA